MKTGAPRDEPRTMRNEERVRGGDFKRPDGSGAAGRNGNGSGNGNRNGGASGWRVEEEQELSEVESVRSWGTDSSFEGGSGAGRGEILTPPSTVFEGEGRERRRG